MADINQKEEWRKYNTFKEFSKDLKFNKKWYHLTAIFDKDQDGDDFDFNDNSVESDDDFDFNSTLDQAFEYEPDIYLDSVKFDFNSVLMEKYKISEIGLIMSKLNEGSIIDQSAKSYDISKLTDNKEFINFYEAVNQHQFKGFYIKTALEVFDSADDADPIASINDTTKFNHADVSKSILSTLLKVGGGHANEATIQLLGDINHKSKPKNYKDQNVVQLLSNIIPCNNSNPMAFPDTVFMNGKGIIPIDLKVAYSGRMSAASGRNIRYMSGIYNALLNAIDNKQTLVDYIKNAVIGVKHNASLLSGVETTMLPELKGFLLISSTLYDANNGRLDYSGICLRPIIACMHGRTKFADDPLFASKDGRGQGSISYDNGSDAEYNEKDSILNGCPLRFATVIKNFYNILINNEGMSEKYGDLKLFLDTDITTNPEFKNNVSKIAQAIGIEFDFNEENLEEK